MDNWNEINFSDLKGKTIKTITGLCKDSDKVVFVCTDGTKYCMNHYQSCCENVEIEDVCGDVEDLINSTILVAEEVKGANIPPKKESHDSYTWTFYKIATAKGYVDIRWYGVSNGYYSESVSFEKCEIPIDSARPKSTTSARDRFRFRVWDKEQEIYHYDAEDTYDFMCGSPVIHEEHFSILMENEKYVLEQCTGLKDKNGNLIYEGDIVDAYDLDRGVVDWVKSQYQIIRCQSKLPIILKSEMFVEIIGNVHENRELLEEE